jgi:hypothetical protein
MPAKRQFARFAHSKPQFACFYNPSAPFEGLNPMAKTSAPPAQTADEMLKDASAAPAEPPPPPPDYPDSPAVGISAEELAEMPDTERAELLAKHHAFLAPKVEEAIQSMQTHTYPDGSARHGCPPFPKESPIQQQQREHREAQERADPSLIGLTERQQALGQENVVTADQVNQRNG